MNILLVDIETSPNMAFVWGLWKETIPIQRLIESSEVLCWSAKWFGEDKVMFSSLNKDEPKVMLAKIHSLLNQADVVVHYNGTAFDIPSLNKEFLLYGFTPPSPYRQLDLLQVARKQFKFVSNKLDYIAQKLGLGEKIETTFQLWVDCMNNVSEAWEKMEEYNKHDVVLLERLYEKFRPWCKPHPNYTLYTEDNELMCPVCGSKKYHRRGFAYTAVGKYQRFRCIDCGTWYKDRKNLVKKQTVQA